MRDTLFGIIFIILGLVYILFFSKAKLKNNEGYHYSIKGITAGIVSIILGIAFLLGKFK